MDEMVDNDAYLCQNCGRHFFEGCKPSCEVCICGTKRGPDYGCIYPAGHNCSCKNDKCLPEDCRADEHKCSCQKNGELCRAEEHEQCHMTKSALKT
jgi:hypothetical protein